MLCKMTGQREKIYRISVLERSNCRKIYPAAEIEEGLGEITHRRVSVLKVEANDGIRDQDEA